MTPAPSVPASIAAGIGAGVGQVALGAQRYLGKGLDAIGLDTAGQWLVSDAEQVRAKQYGELTPYKEANPMSAGGGEMAGNLAATLPVGGALAQLLKPAAAVLPAAVNPLVAAIQSSGFRAGGLNGARGLAARTAGGGITGGASAGLVNDDNAGTGALVGAALPGVWRGSAELMSAAAKTVRNAIEPFSAAGQGRIADRVVRELAEGGPTTVDAAVLVPGSVPTLAQATGNPSIAGLERGLRNDLTLSPQFTARDQANAAARNAAFEEAAGDASKLDFFRADRASTADNLYGQAMARFNGNLTPALNKEVGEVLKRPSVSEAKRVAERWAAERGEKMTPDGSLRGLHDIKTAFDDAIGAAVRENKGGEAKALQATKDKLLAVMDEMSPEYAQASATYAQMSQPVNAMEALQGLKLTDQFGNMTLAKVQGAIRSLQDKIAAPGVNAAKSIDAQQIATLTAIRDDLLRASNTGLGRAVGSNTMQNIAVDRLLTDALPFGNRLSQTALGGIAKRAGQLLYGGADQPIREQMAARLLDPALGAAALAPAAQNRLAALTAQVNSMPLISGASNALAELGYRAAPLISTSR